MFVTGIALGSGFMRFTADGGGPVVEATAAFEDGSMLSVAPAVPGYSGLSVASTVEVSLTLTPTPTLTPTLTLTLTLTPTLTLALSQA